MRRIEIMLYEYPFMNEKIQQLDSQLKDIMLRKNGLYNCLKSAAAKEITIQHTQSSDPTYEIVEKIICKYNAEIQVLAEKITAIIDEKDYIEGRLNLLTPQEHEIIDLRFFQGLQWGVLRRKVRYERAQCFRIYNKAIEKIRSYHEEDIAT